MIDLPFYPIMLYSGYYNYDSINPFIINSNFFYITKCSVPNVLFFKNNTNEFIFYNLPDSIFNDSEYLLKEIMNFNG